MSAVRKSEILDAVEIIISYHCAVDRNLLWEALHASIDAHKAVGGPGLPVGNMMLAWYGVHVLERTLMDLWDHSRDETGLINFHFNSP